MVTASSARQINVILIVNVLCYFNWIIEAIDNFQLNLGAFIDSRDAVIFN